MPERESAPEEGRGRPAVRVGLIGAGRHGSRYAGYLAAGIPGLEFTALSRRSATGAAQAAEWGVRFLTEWKDLVAHPSVDAVAAVLPPKLHPEVAGACADRGKPLLVEKPLALSSVDGLAMVEAFRRGGIPLTVAQTLRYNPVIRAFRDSIGRIGTLRFFSLSSHVDRTSFFRPGDQDPREPGIVHRLGIHLFDALRYVTGRAVLQVRAAALSSKASDPADLVTVQVRSEGDLTGTITLSSTGETRAGRVEIIGDGGMLEGDHFRGQAMLTAGRASREIVSGAPAHAIPVLLEEWSACLAGRGANPVPGEEALRAVFDCDACLESAGGSGWVRPAPREAQG